jgi:hypothetical protein
MLENMDVDKRAVCSWNEQKFAFPQCEEITEILLYKINQFKGLVQHKHSTLEEFLTMSNGLLKKDLATHEQRIIGGSCTTNPDAVCDGFWDMVMNSALAKDVYETHKDEPKIRQSQHSLDSIRDQSLFGLTASMRMTMTSGFGAIGASQPGMRTTSGFGAIGAPQPGVELSRGTNVFSKPIAY